jgi:hypothetical protein
MGMLADYTAFPVDNLGDPNQAQPFGCLGISPTEDLNAAHDSGDPISPPNKVYTLSNIGGAPLDWTLTLSETWVDASALSGSLAPGQSVNVVVSFNTEADDLPSQDDPYTATMSFVNTTGSGCGSLSLGISLEVTGEIFEQFDGDFVFPENAFVGDGQYFTIQTVQGENRVFFDCLYHGMYQDHSNGDMPVIQTDLLYPKGVFRSQWSGTSTYDSGTDSYTGSIDAELSESGFFPNPYVSGAGPNRSFSADTFDLLFNQLLGGGLGRFFFASEKFTEGGTQEGTFVKKFFSPPGGGVGSFISGVMGFIWVDGYDLVITNSGQITVEDLGHSVDTTGVAARTQHLVSYDSGSNTYTGNKSRAKKNVAIPLGKTKLIADFKFLVTPDDLSDPYFVYVTKEYDVTPASTYQAVIEFPWITAATVYYVSGTFGFSPSIYQGWTPIRELGNNGAEDDVVPGGAAWPDDIRFFLPAPNASAYDDFRKFGGSDGFIYGLNSGYGWVDGEFYITRDITGAYDEFENYPDGAIVAEMLGIGWFIGGTYIIRHVFDGYDEFSEYPDGAILTEDGGVGDWAGNGEYIN